MPSLKQAQPPFQLTAAAAVALPNQQNPLPTFGEIATYDQPDLRRWLQLQRDELLTALGLAGATSITLPVGVTVLWPTATPDPGWLICNGAVYSPGTYPDLYTLIGTFFGGSAGSPLLPDYRNRSPYGAGATVALGATGGAETHTLTNAQVPQHNHDVQRTNQAASSVGADASVVYQTATSTGTTYATTTNSGGGGAHNNLHPVLGMHFAIKALA